MPPKPSTVVDDESCEFGEWEVRGDARAETRSHFSTGITSVVPSTQASPLLLD
jgi:hypothetical protein